MYLCDFFRLVPKKRNVKINRKKGVIFNNPIGMKIYIFYISNLLLILGLCLIFYVYFPVGQAVIKFRIYENKIANQPVEKTVVDPNENDNLTKIDKSIFRISVPKILAEAKITANVSPWDKESFSKILNDGSVAMATGSDLPGSGPGSSMFLFSHSTLQDIFGARKNAVFYLLGELVSGDVIYIEYQGQKYTYRVFKSEVVAASQTEYLDYSQDNKETLILQTCWPLGTNWKRLIILANRVK